MKEETVARQEQTGQQHRPSAFRPRGILSARRYALVTTTVAGLGAAALLVPPSLDFGANFFSTPALAQNSPPTQEARPTPAGFADVVAKVKPAVISVRVKEANGRSSAQRELPSRFLDGAVLPALRHAGRHDPELERDGRPRAAGPAPIPHRAGLRLLHLPRRLCGDQLPRGDGADSVEISLDDGKLHTGKVVGRDQRTDLALIKVDGRTDFPYVKLADQPPRIGDWVLAIGNPFGLSSTVTAGIVSARGRDIGAGPYDDFIQIDAPVNRGNSGGPAFDTDGNVIGVNAAIYSPSGGNVGIAFAIPAETVKMVVGQLREKGSVTRGWLGVADPVRHTRYRRQHGTEEGGRRPGCGAATRQPRDQGRHHGRRRCRQHRRHAGQGCARAGTQGAAMAPGSEIKLGIIRKGAEQTVTVTLGEMAREREARAGSDERAAGGAKETRDRPDGRACQNRRRRR